MNGTFAFNNAEEFNEIFGMRTTQDGKKVRKNKILLRFLQDKKMHTFLREKMSYSADRFFKLTDLSKLTSLCSDYGLLGGHDINIMNLGFSSNLYETDSLKGLCEDGDIKCIRYVNKENGRVFKMKAGKMYKHLLSMTEFGRNLPESTILYLCEDFAQKWGAYAAGYAFELHVDDNFEGIYSKSACGGRYFHSCMTDENQHSFYENAVTAKAAYLTNKEGDIVARCIVFPEVHEVGSDRIWRLAERQYAPEGYPEYNQDLMKQILVTALIKGGHIDGYKKVGASYEQPHSFLTNSGESLSDKGFWIECNLEPGDTISYQDTFKFYNPDRNRAYNESGHGGYDDLGTCERTYREEDTEDAWDNYHEEYCHETTTVHYHGREIECNSERLGDFVEVHGEWYHEDDVAYCAHCEDPFVINDYSSYYSELTGEDYCCESCMEEAENEWHKDNGDVWDEWNDEWISKDDAVEVCSRTYWGIFKNYWISKDDVESALEDGTIMEIHGCYGEPDTMPKDYTRLGGWGTALTEISIADIVPAC